jgi:hypothetical protein
MEQTTNPKPPPGNERRTRGDTRSKLSIDEERIIKLASPPPGRASVTTAAANAPFDAGRGPAHANILQIS